VGSIYISSLAFTGLTPEEIINTARNHNFSLEFSSGMPYRPDMEQLYLEADIKKIPHNYFPAPSIPFVLNLASKEISIRDQSVNHCINGLLLAKQAGAAFFSAHAGFCIDPIPTELGRKIEYSPLFDKEEHKQIFLESLKIILKEAKGMGMQFLIENNVIAPFNIVEGKNPLLCCESSEINWLFNEVNDTELGLLLDTAHLKVSCQTLGLQKDNELKNIEPWIRAIHHSDNNGLVDDNQLIDNNYWFLPYLERFKNLLHVIEVKNIGIDVIKDQINLLQSYGC